MALLMYREMKFRAKFQSADLQASNRSPASVLSSIIQNDGMLAQSQSDTFRPTLRYQKY